MESEATTKNPTTKKINGIDEFLHFAMDFKNVASITTKIVMIVPIVAAAAKIGPPPALTPYFTAMVVLAVLIWTFHFWSETHKDHLNNYLRLSLIITMVSFLAYFSLSEQFVAESRSGKRIVLGTSLHPQLASRVDAKVREDKERVKQQEEEKKYVEKYNEFYKNEEPIPRFIPEPGSGETGLVREHPPKPIPTVEPAKSLTELQSEVVAWALERKDITYIYTEGATLMSAILIILWAILVGSWTIFIVVFVIVQRSTPAKLP